MSKHIDANPFSMLFDNKADAEIARIKAHLVIMLMSELRTVAGTRSGMAEVLGCSLSEISRISKGNVTGVSIEKLLKHLSTMNVSLKSSLDVDVELQKVKSITISSL